MEDKETYLAADVDFNRDDDKERLGCQRRIIDMSTSGSMVVISFGLGRKENDTMTLLFDKAEFLMHLGKLVL